VGGIAELARAQESYDGLLLIGVLEHLPAPRPALRDLAQRVAAGGMIYCAQPDVEGFDGCRNAPFQQFSEEHINFYSPTSLRNLFGALGWTVGRCWQWHVEWRAGVIDPVVSVALHRGDPAGPIACRRTAAALRGYCAASDAADGQLRRRIAAAVAQGGAWAVWGLGAQARRLIAEGAFERVPIRWFVDRNPHVAAIPFRDVAVITPDRLPLEDPELQIMICSQAFGGEIRTEIERRGFRGLVVDLFPSDGAS
jgi:hypothetical protein